MRAYLSWLASYLIAYDMYGNGTRCRLPTAAARFQYFPQVDHTYSPLMTPGPTPGAVDQLTGMPLETWPEGMHAPNAPAILLSNEANAPAMLLSNEANAPTILLNNEVNA